VRQLRMVKWNGCNIVHFMVMLTLLLPLCAHLRTLEEPTDSSTCAH
jgi:hypothetical protein